MNSHKQLIQKFYACFQNKDYKGMQECYADNGKIVQHIDSFSFYNWAKQALGFTDLLLGWPPFLKNKIRSIAMKSLQDFMKQSNI